MYLPSCSQLALIVYCYYILHLYTKQNKNVWWVRRLSGKQKSWILKWKVKYISLCLYKGMNNVILSFSMWRNIRLSIYLSLILFLKVKTINENLTIGKISKYWSGFVNNVFTNADNFGIHVPADLDVRVKAAMIGACFLFVSMVLKSVTNLFLSLSIVSYKHSISHPPGLSFT